MTTSRRTILLDVSTPPLAQALKDSFAADATVHTLPSNVAPDAVSSQYPSTDALILSPRVNSPQPADSLTATWEAAGEPALRRCIGLMTAVGAGMVVRQRGVILVIGGLSGLTGFPGWTLASTLEGALVALTRSLACEWSPHGVRVLYLAASPSEEVPLENGVGTGTTASFTERTPLKRLATPEAIAKVAHYLAGERASFVTGTPVRADGGWTSWGLLR